MGNYIIEKPNTEEVGAKTEFTGYDYMIKFNCTYKNRVKFPCKASVLLQDICSQAGVECGSLSFINSEYMILGNPFTNNENCKTVLSNIAQLAVGYTYIGRDNKLYIKTLKTTAHLLSVKEVHKMSVKELNMTPVYKLAGISSVAEEKVDGNNYFEFFKNNKFGKVNSLVLKISGIDGENTAENDQDSIKDDGLTEISIEDNYFLNTEEERKKVINPMWNALKGLEYLPFETTYYGYPYLDVGDPIVIADTDDKEYFSYVFNYTFEYDGSYNGTLKTEAMTKTQTAYKNSENLKSRFRRAERTINKIEGTIEDIIEQQDENTEKLTKHEQTIESISDKVSHIEETTNTIEGNKTISLGNAVAGELIELHIYGNNDVFSSLKIGDDVVLSDDLYLLGDSIIVVTDSKGNSKEYELEIKDVLRQKDDVYDEYVFKDGKAQIIRRINPDGTIKAKETIENLGAFSIELFDGTNTLSIKNYTASLKVKFAIQNDMTNIYASKVEMNSAINQTAEQVDINVNKKLESYSKTTEMNAAIKLVSDNITSEVNKKVGKTEVGTYIQQNAEAVKLAWNQISEFIQMMIINNNASFAILDSNKKVLMSLDKTGQHFYKSDGTTIFGDMGVQKEDNDQYIAFSVFADYNQKLSNGMAWGIKTKSDNKFHPIFYIKNFEMAEKASDASYGELVLASCNILLDGISTGIIGGNIKMYADEVNSAIQFINTDTNTILLSISTQDLESGYAKIKLLDNISVYKNVGGTNSFRFGSGNNYTLIEDDGSISAYGGTIRFGITGREVSFDLYVKNMASIYGNLNVNGNVYANNISSDRRIKDNIKDCDVKALDIINKFQHKQFDKKDDGKHYNIGYIAQDMEEIDPNFIIKREKTDTLEERYYINELPIIATLSKAIQELSQQVEALQNEIKVLKEEKQ